MPIYEDIHVALQQRSVDKAAAELERKFSSVNANISPEVKAAEIRAAAEKIKREMGDIKIHLNVDIDRGGAIAATTLSRALHGITDSAGEAHRGLMTLGTTAMKTARGLGALGAVPATIAVLDFAKAAVTASQSIALLPAGIAAIGSAYGTLQLATAGVGDALDAVFDPKKRADPEKFAAAIQSLSPAAQQAVLSIRALVPEFDALKNATQDAFFAGLGDQIQNLTSIYLPSIQEMTTGIAGAFNQMMTGIGNQLAMPETQAQIQTTMQNITLAFQNAAPAAQSFAQAFIDIMEVGSEFLPGMGTGIANVAQQFADFIREARDSGKLAQWIEEGITAVGQLKDGVIELAKGLGDIYNLFTEGAGVDDFKDDMQGLHQIVGFLSGDFLQLGDDIKLEFTQINEGPARDFINMWLDIPEAIATAANAVKHVIDGMMQNLVTDLNHMADILPDSVNKQLFGTEHPKPFSFTPSGDFPANGDWGDLGQPPAAPGPYSNRNYANQPDNAPGQAQTWTNPQTGQKMVLVPKVGWVPEGDPRAAGPGNPPPGSRYDVPPPPPEKGGKKPSERDLRDQIIMGLDPALWRVDPFAPVPGQPAVPGLPQNGYAAPGYGVDQQTMLDDRNKIISEAHDLEEARKERLALERDNNASAKDIEDAKWKEYESGVSLQKAQAKLAEDMTGKNRKVKQGMDELSAALDPDLGLSKGLAGFADNLVRFLGSLALAGPMAKLNEIKNANEEATGIQGGYGLMGIMGAKNLAAGKSPLLGQPLPYDSTATPDTSSGGVYPSAYNNTPMPSADVMPSILEDTGRTPSGPQSRQAASLIQQIFGSQIQGKIGGSRDTNTAPGTHDTGTSIDIPIAESQRGAGGLGDQIRDWLQANAGSLGLKYTIWRGQGQYPGGGGFNQGGHQDHIDAHFNGVGGSGGPVSTSSSGGAYSSFGGSGSIPIPLPVTIVGGGAPGAGGDGGAPGAPGGAAPPVGPGSLWDKVAQGESGGNWQHPGSAGNQHFGGLQFSPSTWKAFGGVDLTGKTNPAEATREQQIEIANRTAFKGYKGSNPQGLSAFEAITKGMVPGVTTATPASAFMTSTPGNPYAGPYETYGQPPAPPGAGPLPTIPAGAGSGQGYMGLPAGPGAPPGPTQIGGLAPKSGTGEGGIGITPGGSLETAMDLAASAFPGVGQAAATGMKLASRAIQYGGQVAGIGMQGLMETFLPTGMSELANNSWLTRMVGALAGAAPALPNLAGKSATSPGPLTPEQVAANGGAGGQGAGPAPGPVQITYNNNGATEDRAGKDLAYHQERLQQPPGQR